MVGFVNFTQDLAEIEHEIVRKGVALGIDWSDKAAVRALAHEAVNHLGETAHVPANGPVDYQRLARIDLFGLAGVMLKMMEESAEQGMLGHGGPIWQTFAQALWDEAGRRTAGGGVEPGAGNS